MKDYTRTGVVVLLLALVAGCASSEKASSTKTVEVGTQTSEAVRATVEIQSLREELASLRNEIELQGNQLQNLLRRQRELYDDLDYRLRQRERAAGMDVSTAQPSSGVYGSNTGTGFGASDPNVTGSNVSSGTAGSWEQSPGTQGAVGTGGASQIGGQTTAAIGTTMQPEAPQQAAIATPEEQLAYDQAFNLLKQSRYGESVAAFQQLLAQYPNGALADDAQYWIGEAMYVTRDFSGGLQAFQAVVDRFPESARVAEAMLKLGYIQYEIGAKEQARQTLTQVVNRFPGSRVAISAQTRLRKLESELGG